MILDFIVQVSPILVNRSLIQLEAKISQSQKSHSYNSYREIWTAA